MYRCAKTAPDTRPCWLPAGTLWTPLHAATFQEHGKVNALLFEACAWLEGSHSSPPPPHPHPTIAGCPHAAVC